MTAIEEIQRFIKAHEACGGMVAAATDVAPEVIRLDCLECGRKIEVPQVPGKEPGLCT